jgi:hypothetical protein
MKKTLVLSLFFSCIFLLAAQSPGSPGDTGGVNTYFGTNVVPDPAFATCANVTPGTNWTCTAGTGLVAANAPTNSNTTITPVTTSGVLYYMEITISSYTSGTVAVDPDGHGIMGVTCHAATTCSGTILLLSTGGHTTAYIRAYGSTFTGTVSSIKIQPVL